jgi:hypothetical protein
MAFRHGLREILGDGGPKTAGESRACDWNLTNAGPTLRGLRFEIVSLYNEAEACMGERVILTAKLLIP